PVGPGPVDGPHVRALAGITPTITGIHAAGRVDALVNVGGTLVLEGEGLLGEQTQVDVGGFPGLGVVTSARGDRATVVIPDDPRLMPGILELRLSHGVTLGVPPERHAVLTSNTVAFALAPHVKDATADGAHAFATITGNRLYQPDVECVTLIQGIAVP